MKSPKTMTYAVAAATAATLLLAGCNGGDDHPTPTPSPTNSSSSSASDGSGPSASASPKTTPSASVPGDIPAGARANSRDGAVAFVRYYLSQEEVSREKGSGAPLLALAATNCDYCSTLAGFIEADAQKGLRTRDARTTVDLIEVETIASPTAVVRVLATDQEAELVDASGKTVRKQPGAKVNLRFKIAHGGSSWTIQEVEIL